MNSFSAPETIGSSARAAEGLGFATVWIPEDYYGVSSIVGAQSALYHTKSIQVGTAVASISTRHSALLAMEFGALSRLSGGRFIAGMGLGAPHRLREMRVPHSRTLHVLQQYVQTVQAVLAGDAPPVDEILVSGVRLTHDTRYAVPIYLGVMNQMALRMSGRIADGTIIGVRAGAPYIKWACARIAEGLQEPTRPANAPTHRIVLFVIFAVGDRGEAKRSARSLLAFYLRSGGRMPYTDAHGISDEVEELARRDLKSFERAMPDRWVDELTVSGDFDECAEGLKRFAALHGVDSIALVPASAAEADDAVRLAATEVIPRL